MCDAQTTDVGSTNRRAFQFGSLPTHPTPVTSVGSGEAGGGDV